MPVIPSPTEMRAPEVGHFALLMDESGARLAIRPGASLWLVEDASQADKIYPLTLKKVTHKKITFEMTNKEGIVREYSFKLESTKPASRAALLQFQRNRGDKPVKVQK